MTKITLFLFGSLIITATSCNTETKTSQNNEHLNDSIPKEQVSVLKLDTLTADNYLLTFTGTTAFPLTDIYEDLCGIKIIDSIDTTNVRAKKIQSCISSKFGKYFHETKSQLTVKLANGRTKTFLNDTIGDTSFAIYNFEYYFEKIDYCLIYVSAYEGHGYYLLINRKNGVQKELTGFPHFSNDNKQIISITSESYLTLGIQLHTVLTDSIRTEFEIATSNEYWQPTDVKWVNENQFLLKSENETIENKSARFDYKLVTFKKTSP